MLCFFSQLLVFTVGAFYFTNFLLLSDCSISFAHKVALSLPIPMCILSLSYVFVCVCLILFFLLKTQESLCVAFSVQIVARTWKYDQKAERRNDGDVQRRWVIVLCVVYIYIYIYMWSKRLNERTSERTKRDQSHKIIYTSMCMLLLFFFHLLTCLLLWITHIYVFIIFNASKNSDTNECNKQQCTFEPNQSTMKITSHQIYTTKNVFSMHIYTHAHNKSANLCNLQ